MSTESQPAELSPQPRWRPLESIERRVLGVLVEKAKTTPEAYPLSLNALRSGCNQKNNRAPLMQLEESQIEEALEGLRKVGAVSVIQGGARIDRYRHLAYEWLGVDKVELAVMAELLLRGSQTVGELRGRAARMEPIKGLSELQPTLDSLEAKRLIQYLTPPGRGSVVTHTLYLDREMEKVRREAGQHAAVAAETTTEDSPRQPSAPSAPRSPAPPSASSSTETDSLREEIDSLRNELAVLKQDLDAARTEFTETADALKRELDDLNRQLGN
jgi:uncharacterized protein YceH (UPF0502 family)